MERALRRLQFPSGWILAAVIALAWPLLMLAQHGSAAFALWSMHVADRLIGQTGPGPFAGEPWWEYVPAILAQALPWTPLALWGAWRSLGRALVRTALSATAIALCRCSGSPSSDGRRPFALGLDGHALGLLSWRLSRMPIMPSPLKFPGRSGRHWPWHGWESGYGGEGRSSECRAPGDAGWVHDAGTCLRAGLLAPGPLV